jgi:arylsulfatase A-like enzyme
MQVPGVSAKQVDHLVQNIDYAPTFLDVAGVDIPERVQGKSFYPLLTGGAYTPHTEVFLERNYHSGNPKGEPLSTDQANSYFDPMRAVRTDRFRYIRHLAENPMRYWLPKEVEDRLGTEYEVVWNYLWPQMTEPRDPEELFDLENDPNETRNLADDAEFQSTKPDLSDRVDRWMAETVDPILEGEIRDRLHPWGDIAG